MKAIHKLLVTVAVAAPIAAAIATGYKSFPACCTQCGNANHWNVCYATCDAQCNAIYQMSCHAACDDRCLPQFSPCY